MARPEPRSAFTAWLRAEFAKRNVSTDSQIARQLGLSTSTITRGARHPGPDTIRAAAVALGIPVRRVLVAAGYLTSDEADVSVAHPPLSTVSSDDLLKELRTRLRDAGEEDQGPGAEWEGA